MYGRARGRLIIQHVFPNLLVASISFLFYTHILCILSFKFIAFLQLCGYTNACLYMWYDIHWHLWNSYYLLASLSTADILINAYVQCNAKKHTHVLLNFYYIILFISIWCIYYISSMIRKSVWRMYLSLVCLCNCHVKLQCAKEWIWFFLSILRYLANSYFSYIYVW